MNQKNIDRCVGDMLASVPLAERKAMLASNNWRRRHGYPLRRGSFNRFYKETILCSHYGYMYRKHGTMAHFLSDADLAAKVIKNPFCLYPNIFGEIDPEAMANNALKTMRRGSTGG